MLYEYARSTIRTRVMLVEVIGYQVFISVRDRPYSIILTRAIDDPANSTAFIVGIVDPLNNSLCTLILTDNQLWVTLSPQISIASLGIGYLKKHLEQTILLVDALPDSLMPLMSPDHGRIKEAIDMHLKSKDSISFLF